ncbi:MAG: hypothetical protein QOI14_1015, partial [Actinomycetota bacterium]|nr:hypothetical protein [Actinomycetota bacterium]
MAIDVSPREVLRLRLRTQRIEGAASTTAASTTAAIATVASAATASATVADTVRHLLATQAQDFAQSLWAVGLRTPGATRSDVLAALESGEVVRTLPMRGTLHLVPAEDL